MAGEESDPFGAILLALGVLVLIVIQLIKRRRRDK